MLSFDEFTDALDKAGWRADCDAQHTKVIAVYDEMISESRKAQQITALRAELAEAKKDAERLDFLDSLPLRTDPSLSKCNWLNSDMHFSNNRVVIYLRNSIGRAIRTGYGNSAREAIDAAIAGEKK